MAETLLHAVMMQMLAYGIAMLIPIFAMVFLLRGFLGNYLKVRATFGKFILVRIRKSTLLKYYTIGWVEKDILHYLKKDKLTKKKQTIMINIPEGQDVFYRSLSVLWVDIDEEKSAILTANYIAVSGFNPEKMDDIVTRTAQIPHIKEKKKEDITLLLAGVAALGVVIIIYLEYQQGKKFDTLISYATRTFDMMQAQAHPVIASSTVI